MSINKFANPNSNTSKTLQERIIIDLDNNTNLAHDDIITSSILNDTSALETTTDDSAAYLLGNNSEMNLSKVQRRKMERLSKSNISAIEIPKANGHNEHYELNKQVNDAYSIPKVPCDEIKRIICNLPNNKLPGISNIKNELIKYSNDSWIHYTRILIELIINYRQMPDTLNTGLLFPIIKDENRRRQYM